MLERTGYGDSGEPAKDDSGERGTLVGMRRRGTRGGVPATLEVVATAYGAIDAKSVVEGRGE